MAKKANKDEAVDKTVEVETTVDAVEEVMETVEPPVGKPNPATGSVHDCDTEGRFRSISVGGKRMRECTVCGNRV